MSIRKRQLKGWYPESGEECRKFIKDCVQDVKKLDVEGRYGGIVPHAGWYFSGRLAAKVFYLLSLKTEPDVVIVYGGHLGWDLPQIVTEERWETPLGEIEIEQNLVKRLSEEIMCDRESPYSQDNTIEINLPFVKYFFPQSKLLAIRSPHSEKAVEVGVKVAEIVKDEGISTIVFGSTDLTHYGPFYGFYLEELGEKAVKWVEENDRKFIERAIEMDYEGVLKVALENNNACSAGAAASAIVTCRELGSKKGILVDYYTSYDVSPDVNFVGYSGIIF
jgi:hypothetical protein